LAEKPRATRGALDCRSAGGNHCSSGPGSGVLMGVNVSYALVGPPNSGKTTLFNALTGSHSRPVNYPGSTVDYTVGKLKATATPIIDTPGVYSLSPKSPEEIVTWGLLFGTNRPTKVILVLDATQLSRQLLLARQVIETGYPVVIAITMGDLLAEQKQGLNVEKLSKGLGVPVIPVAAFESKGVAALLQELALPSKQNAANQPVPWTTKRIDFEQRELLKLSESVLAPSAQTSGPSYSTADWTRFLDRWFLNPWMGLVLFAAIMGLVFTSVFWVAAPLMDGVSGFFEWLASRAIALAPGSLWADFLGGIFLSFGAILTFVPQIMILFLGVTLLEDSGYLARAATLVDRPLGAVGLGGRAFVPLLSGYACAIPAMLAARSINNRRERWLTLFITPLMSCSARLPVYSLLLSFIFWGEPAWKPGLALLFVYLGSLFVGAGVASVLNRILRKDQTSFFILELPVYRAPQFKTVLKTVLNRTESYLRKAGPAILVLSLLIWFGTTFPNYGASSASEKLETSYIGMLGRAVDPLMEPMGGDWRTGIALVSAFAAREVFVAALSLVLQVSESASEGTAEPLLASMQVATRSDGSPLFTTGSALALIVFFLIAMQCMSTFAVARREFGGWRYPILQLIGFNLLAYGLAVATYQICRL
jgi:ferrous iron transport protein B